MVNVIQHLSPFMSPSEIMNTKIVPQKFVRAAMAASSVKKKPEALISERLLQGYAMMAIHCPICLSPILRSRLVLMGSEQTTDLKLVVVSKQLGSQASLPRYLVRVFLLEVEMARRFVWCVMFR